MRTLGLLGIALLLAVNALGMLIAVQRDDWRGIALMAFMAAMLAFFARTLWRGRRTEQDSRSGHTLAPAWYRESVSSFFVNQVAKSPEGLLFVVGSGISLALAIASLTVPTSIGLPADRANTSATLFGVWPILAFVLYIRICGPSFKTSVFTIVAMLAVVVAPIFIAYR